MTVILIDTKYIGQSLKSARRQCRLGKVAAANTLHIPISDLIRYERGKTVIPNDVLVRLLRHGLNS